VSGMVRVNVSHPDPTDADVGRLIEQYKPLVMFVAKSLGFCQIRHYHNGLELEDAMQLGYIALWKASKTFDPSKASSEGTAFAAYAATKIRHEIFNEVRRCRWFRGPRDVNGEIWQLLSPRESDTWTSDDDYAMGWKSRRKLMESHLTPECLAEEQELMGMIDASIERMDLKRRNIYQGIMRHDDAESKAKKGQDYYGLSPSRVSQLRMDIRKKLREALH